VYGPGKYRFMDFVKVGVPLTLILSILVLALIPVFWPLRPVNEREPATLRPIRRAQVNHKSKRSDQILDMTLQTYKASQNKLKSKSRKDREATRLCRQNLEGGC